MRHEITTLNTKLAFADALRECMKNKPLSKITVSELINICDVNRKTFYYHFSDIYDLLKWMLEQEAFDVVKQFDLTSDYKDAVLFVIQYVHENKHILNCAYDSIGRDEMKRFFYNDFVGITRTYIRNIEEKMELYVTEEFEDFLVQLYTESIAAMLINEFKENEPHNPHKAVEYMSLALKASLPAVLENAPKKH